MQKSRLGIARQWDIEIYGSFVRNASKLIMLEF